MKTLTIIMPVYNEEKTILSILNRLHSTKSENINYQIIVIDDASTDGTVNILKTNSHLYDLIIFKEKNEGKGSAVKAGIQKAIGDYVIFQDADLEYDPEEFKDFIKVIHRFNPDLILGSRFIYKHYTRSHYFFNKIGNIILSNFFNLLYDSTFTDIYSCYLCFKKDLISANELKTVGFEQHAEILCKLVKKGRLFYEIPISYNGRSVQEGKKIKFYHFFVVILQIVKEKFK